EASRLVQVFLCLLELLFSASEIERADTEDTGEEETKAFGCVRELIVPYILEALVGVRHQLGGVREIALAGAQDAGDEVIRGIEESQRSRRVGMLCLHGDLRARASDAFERARKGASVLPNRGGKR